VSIEPMIGKPYTVRIPVEIRAPIVPPPPQPPTAEPPYTIHIPPPQLLVPLAPVTGGHAPSMYAIPQYVPHSLPTVMRHEYVKRQASSIIGMTRLIALTQSRQ